MDQAAVRSRNGSHRCSPQQQKMRKKVARL
jgi:hypothetical protein